MANYLDGAVIVSMPTAAGVINGFNGAVTVAMPTASGVIAASIPYLDGAVTVEMPTADGTIVITPVLNGAVTVDMPTADGTFLSVTVLSGAVTVEMPKAAGILGGFLDGAVTVAMPTVAGTIAGSIPILDGAVTVEMPTAAGTFGFVTPSSFNVIVMNLKNNGVSLYTGFNFNSACYFNGHYLAANSSTGIHELTGSTDNGTAISAYATLGAYDFGEPNHKNIHDVYVDFSGGALAITSAIDSSSESSDRSIAAPTAGEIETKRAKLPISSTGRHWQLKVKNVSGSDFEIHGMKIPVDVLAREV